jgi:hypothetical protein
MRIKRIKIIAALFCFIFLSCHKSQPSWDVQILAPVVNATLSINDIITSKYINSNKADSSVSLMYTDSLYNLNMDTLLNIPDTVFKYDTIWPLFFPNYIATPGTYVLPPKVQTQQYNIGSAELVKGILKTGWLVYKIRNPLKQPVDYYYKVYNIMVNGDTLKLQKVKVDADSTVIDSISLAGATINFRGPAKNGYNEMTTSIWAVLDPSASNDTITPTDTLINIQISFNELIPTYAQGYFGTTTKSFGPENVAFPVFNKIISGSLNLQNVNVTLSLTNGFGADASIDLFKLTSNRPGDTIPLVAHGVVGSTININRATATNNPASPVIPSVTNFTLTPSNSNILAWLDNLPTSVGYALSVTTDPLGNVSGFNDFAYYGYGISSNINVTIPLSLIANNLTLADTLAINFGGSGGATKQVKSGKLTIYASNGFPFSAGLQMYLLNSSNVVCDSLFIPSQDIQAAPVNSVTGKVINPQNSVLTISLNASKTQELFNTKNVILYAKFNMGSKPSTYMTIYSYYQLGLKLAGNFDYTVN